VHAVVTGDAGFIGTHLVRRLVEEGLTVTVVERPGAPLENLSGLDVRLFTANIVLPGSILPVLERCDVLFHLAANPRLWAYDRQEFRRTNTEGTRNVTDKPFSPPAPPPRRPSPPLGDRGPRVVTPCWAPRRRGVKPIQCFTLEGGK
jgi:NAD(P)-dependent dehydrogenase (short-subunit alcohol dehydrogenase family)